MDPLQRYQNRTSFERELFQLVEKQYNHVDGITRQDVDDLKRFFRRVHLSLEVVDINSYNADGLTPLQIITKIKIPGSSLEISKERELCTMEAITLLLTEGADINKNDEFSKDVLGLRTGLGATTLHWACIFGTYQVIMLLLHHGADPYIPDAEGHTPLCYATVWRNDDTMKALLDSRVDINIQDKRGLTPFHLLFTFPDVVHSMEDKSYDVVYHFVQLMLEYKLNVYIQTKDGVTPLWLTVITYLNSPEHAVKVLSIIRLILNANVDVNSPILMVIDPYGVGETASKYCLIVGDTPLHCAVRWNAVELVMTILEYHPKLSMQNSKGETALDLARMHNFDKIETIIAQELRIICYQYMLDHWMSMTYQSSIGM